MDKNDKTLRWLMQLSYEPLPRPKTYTWQSLPHSWRHINEGEEDGGRWSVPRWHQWAHAYKHSRGKKGKIWNKKKEKMVWISFECCPPWDNFACSQHEGDVLCLSVMSHLNKCTSGGGADLAFSPSIHHINAISQKRQICIADSAAGPKVCDIYVGVGGVYVCVQWKEEKNRHGRKILKIKKMNKWTDSQAGLFSSSKDLKDFFLFTYAKIWLTPPDPNPHQGKNQLKLPYLMFTLINHNN